MSRGGATDRRGPAIQNGRPTTPRARDRLAGASVSSRFACEKVTGVVVAAIRFDAKGATEAVDIVQSPDAETGRAVHDTLMRWEFRPTMGMPGEGMLFFYFHMKGRDGVVLSPAEMRDGDRPRREATSNPA